VRSAVFDSVRRRWPLVAVAVAAGAAVLLAAISLSGTVSSGAAGDAALPATHAVAANTEQRRAEPSPARQNSAAAVSAATGSHASERTLSSEQLRDLHAALEGHPQREAEIERIGEYLLFAGDVEQLRALLATGAAASNAEAQELARRIDSALAERLARREVTADEALLIKQQVLTVLQPNAAARASQQQQWQARLPANAAPSAQEAEYLNRQAALVAEWQAQPEATRDPRQLEDRLDALRRSHFETAPSR
jgi:hypothetical protein